jgi:hypothetical protein
MIDMQEFFSRIASLQRGLWHIDENVSTQKARLEEKITERAFEGIQFFFSMYVMYKLSLQNPLEVASLISTYEKETIKEISRQVEKASEVEENLSNDPLRAAIKFMLGLPDLETLEGSYIQQIYKVGNLYREFFGIGRTDEEDKF